MTLRATTPFASTVMTDSSLGTGTTIAVTSTASSSSTVKKQACPGQAASFITGGGPQPLVLSEQAASYLDRELA